MGIAVLWADADHQNRAELLARTYNAPAHDFSAVPAQKIPGLDTLTFWGHGAADKFCHVDVPEFLDVVSAWCKANPGVTTVEMISCNLRHRHGTYADSYTMRVVSQLKRRHAHLTFKALPLLVTRMGVACENSVMKWQPTSQTWAYIGTPGKEDKYMFWIGRVLEDEMPPRGNHDGYVRGLAALEASGFLENHKFGKETNGNLKSEPCKPREMLCMANNACVMAGTIGTLRWSLDEIK
jgi:hypothetical protein